MEAEANWSTRWLDPSNYAYTNSLLRDGWAWEFLRRNRDYQTAARTLPIEPTQPRPLTKQIHIIEANDTGQAASWGLHVCETADRSSADAAVFWRSNFNARILPLEARPISSNHDEAFDIRQFDCRVTILHGADAVEHVLISDHSHHIQLEVRGRSLLVGPVLLHYDIKGFADVQPKLLTVHQLVALRRLGRFPHSLFPPDRRSRRLTLALRALDASRAGANPRDIAAAIFGHHTVHRDWDGASDYLRSRVRRAIAAGACLANGRHIDLLGVSRRRSAEPQRDLHANGFAAG